MTRALEEFIACRRQGDLLGLMGKLEWDRGYDDETTRWSGAADYASGS